MLDLVLLASVGVCVLPIGIAVNTLVVGLGLLANVSVCVLPSLVLVLGVHWCFFQFLAGAP